MTEGSTLHLAGREIHYRRFGDGFSGTPLLFLHEGLGSVELWRGFPQDVVIASRRPGLAYSRPGNGWSSALAEPRGRQYMHTEALETLPRLVDRLVGSAPILVGHSDGASIALIYAGAGHPVAGLVLIAPHVFVEAETLRSISAIRDRFLSTDMATRMASYHVDPVSTFHGWADVWLSPEFRSWDIQDCLPRVHCPVLVIQGDSDEYGTLRQLDAIAAGLAAPSERLIVEGAGHSPHLSHPGIVTAAVAGFVLGHF